MVRVLVLVLMAATLAGCAARTHQEAAAMQGGAIGAGTGALIGGLAGGTPGAAVAGGLVGGAVGAITGAAAAGPPPPPPGAVYADPDPETCYVRSRSGRLRPVPCD
jgi:hypothetical protein